MNCQYSMAVFSTGERKRRPRGDRKSLEMTTHLKQTFQAAIRFEIRIVCYYYDAVFLFEKIVRKLVFN